jgi:hypothetical protein
MRQLGFWGGGGARPRKTGLFALQDGKIPDSPPRGPALRGPRRRGVRGGSLSSTTPPLPGPSRPLRGGRRGSSGGGSDPGPGPRPAPPTLWPHTFPPPGGLLPPASPCGVYAGIPGDPPQLHAGRPPLRALPGPSPARRGTFAKMGGPAPSAEGASGRPPPPRCWATLRSQPQMNRRG